MRNISLYNFDECQRMYLLAHAILHATIATKMH